MMGRSVVAVVLATMVLAAPVSSRAGSTEPSLAIATVTSSTDDGAVTRVG